MIGIVGAIVLRTVLILAGAWLLATFHWLLYVFGAFLVITGVKMWFAAGQEPDIATNPVLKLLKKRIRITDHFDGEKLSTMVNGVKHYTPLFAVLVLIGTTDVIFAVDSIPAIFAITSDPFIVLTANIFAILGLRALYFLLADLANRFHLLAYGLALVLIYIGGKMLAMPWFHMPPEVLGPQATPERAMTPTAGPDAPPTPDLTRRDSMGRLVAATWHSAGASSAMAGVKAPTAVMNASARGVACSTRLLAVVQT
eukprot:gene44574-59476_t